VPVAIAVLYWAIGAAENAVSSTKTPFSLQATVQTIGSGIVIGFLQGMAGLTVDPSSITLITAIDTAGPIVLSKFLGSVTGTSTAIAAPAAASSSSSSGSVPAASTTQQGAGLGFTALPNYQVVKSGSPANLTLKFDTQITDLWIDWQDGSPVQHVATGSTGIATISHTYTLTTAELQTATSKYTGHKFSPVFTIADNLGHVQKFDYASSGFTIDCSIVVSS